ncbi:MAG: CoA-acylating methylmalonate-semialdehyde dehydrogenase [Bacteroidetes bacterium]|nr:CoA-acylating methylmalonate-semialdehyde dehydrogenase [Bacteroidota bacterium]
MTAERLLSNVIGGEERGSASGSTMPVIAPATGEVIADVPLSNSGDLDEAVQAAQTAQSDWTHMPLKDRVQVFYRMKTLVEEEKDHLAEVLTRENGKTLAESAGEIARAVECLEFAASLPQTAVGDILEVSRGVECKTTRHPLGVVAGITPFNFPFMVPLWMIPMAIALGNAFILKPSPLTPLSAMEIARLLKQAGLPDGVFSIVHGDKTIVEAICDHTGISALGFVGSTHVAKLVFERGVQAGKRVRALGGAKNHLVVVPDADPEMTATNVVASVTGCAGQRCMAASVLLAVGDTEHIIGRIREKMAAMKGGRELGAIISEQAYDRIMGYIERAEANGATLTLDGREAVAEDAPEGGRFLGPSIIDHATPDHEASCEEIFGPTLTIIRCETLDEALAIENANPYGNAAAIYTSSGATAEYFVDRADAGMIGVNIGVPVPREPFAFGGWNDSSFGDGDITGPGAIDFWTKTKKITTKWSDQHRSNWMS